MNLKIERREVEPGVAVIAIGGRIALGRDSRRIEPAITEAIAAGMKMIVLDLSGVSHVDSTGIGIVSYCFGKATQASAELRIAGAKESVFTVFQITRLVHVVPFFQDVDSALKGTGRVV
jgi:anti-anti-sigma factor